MTVHGDDFLTEDTEAGIREKGVLLGNHFGLKKIGEIGPDSGVRAKFFKRDIGYDVEGD